MSLRILRRTHSLQSVRQKKYHHPRLRYEKENRKREGGDPDRAIAKIESDNDYSALLPKLGLSYQVNEEHTIGLQLSRGYNAGGGGISFGAPIVNYEYERRIRKLIGIIWSTTMG